MSTTKKTPVNVVLCGLGRMGRIHLDNIINAFNVNLTYIIEANLAYAEEVKSEFCLDSTTILHFDDFDKAVTDESTNCVIICTPTDSHEDLLIKSLKAGKHVLCEKPLARNVETIAKCYKLAQDEEVVLLCAFNRRFDPQIQEMIKNKSSVGVMQSVKVCSRDSPKPPMSYLKISGGIFHDCIVHDLDMLRYITQEDPETIYSIAHVYDAEIAALDDVDTVMVVLKFPCGVLAHIDISRDCKFGYDQTIQIYGSEGNLISGNPRKSALTLNGSKQLDDIHYSFKSRYTEAYKVELDHFVEMVRGGKRDECMIKAMDTIKATCLSQAAEDSWKEGRIIDVKKYLETNYGSIFNGGN